MATIYRRAAAACFWLADRLTDAGEWMTERYQAARRALTGAR